MVTGHWRNEAGMTGRLSPCLLTFIVLQVTNEGWRRKANSLVNSVSYSNN